jgi:hypothetical protein
MDNNFTRRFAVTTVLLAGLLVLDWLPGLMAHTESRRRLESVIEEMHNGDLNREDFDALAAGYYEGLRNDVKPTGLPVEKDDIRLRNDFLQYEFRPNVNRRYPAGMRITNNLGMPNPDYTYEKPPHTRRIALLGDSVSVGPYRADYEALLEEKLNQTNSTPQGQKFQILNFSVYGYTVLQMMDVAIEKAPQFHPDVYMVALTQLEANRKGGWGAQISRLVLGRADLKYDFLRSVTAQAGIQPTDHMRVIAAKLEPFFLPVTRWALQQIKDHAAAQGAQMVILLVPTPTNPEIINAEFEDIRPAVDSIGVPVIDLRDTFGSKNLAALQVDPGSDIHPNARAHEMLFENLYRQILQDPKLSACILGSAGDGSRQPAFEGKPSTLSSRLHEDFRQVQHASAR